MCGKIRRWNEENEKEIVNSLQEIDATRRYIDGIFNTVNSNSAIQKTFVSRDDISMVEKSLQDQAGNLDRRCRRANVIQERTVRIIKSLERILLNKLEIISVFVSDRKIISRGGSGKYSGLFVSDFIDLVEIEDDCDYRLKLALSKEDNNPKNITDVVKTIKLLGVFKSDVKELFSSGAQVGPWKTEPDFEVIRFVENLRGVKDELALTAGHEQKIAVSLNRLLKDVRKTEVTCDREILSAESSSRDRRIRSNNPGGSVAAEILEIEVVEPRQFSDINLKRYDNMADQVNVLTGKFCDKITRNVDCDLFHTLNDLLGQELSSKLTLDDARQRLPVTGKGIGKTLLGKMTRKFALRSLELQEHIFERLSVDEKIGFKVSDATWSKDLKKFKQCQKALEETRPNICARDKFSVDRYFDFSRPQLKIGTCEEILSPSG